MPSFLARLDDHGGIASRALTPLILTAARSGEVLGACWRELDLDEAVWTVPTERMKAAKPHRVALAAAEVLYAMLPLQGSADAPIFPGLRAGRPLSNMALAMTLRRMGLGDATVHGFRSTFRDWAGETTAHPREVIEAALAHRTGDKVEQAYASGDLLLRRRKLMDDWATFCGSAPEGAAVHRLPERVRS